MAGRSATYGLYDDCPLNLRESIRLVRIQGSDELSTGISLVMVPFHLPEAPPYTALSYTWSSPILEDGDDTTPGEQIEQATTTVQVNSYEFKVTRNLYDVITMLKRLEQYQYFWIDALCINQCDIREKNLQIPFMSAIFGSAVEVIGWLGPASQTDIANIAWFYARFFPSLRKTRYWPAVWGKGPLLTKSLLQEAGLDIPRTRSSVLRTIQKCNWFSRVWITQEVALAKNIRLLFGPLFLDYQPMLGLFRFADHCASSLWLQLNDSRKLRHGMLVLHRLDLLDCFRSWIHTSHAETCVQRPVREPVYQGCHSVYPSVTLIFMAHKCRFWSCSDHRDRIFALFGVLSALYPGWNEDPFAPLVDYTTSIESLYHKVVLWRITQSSSLNFLTYVEDPSRKHLVTLPSWVPDFSVRCGVTELLRSPDFSAAGRCQWQTGARHSRRTLVARSRIIGSINCRMPQDISKGACASSCSLLELLAFCESMSPTYLTGESRVQALWRTLVANQSDMESSQSDVKSIPSFPASAKLSEHFYQWALMRSAMNLKLDVQDASISSFKQGKITKANLLELQENIHLPVIARFVLLWQVLKELNEIHPTEMPGMFEVLKVADRLFESDFSVGDDNRLVVSSEAANIEYGQEGRRFQYELTNASGRRLLRCDTGHIGLGPESASDGDQLHVLHDCDVPIVLRPCGSHRDPSGKVLQAYRVIGEAYVHGIMQRESHDLEYCNSFEDIALV